MKSQSFVVLLPPPIDLCLQDLQLEFVAAGMAAQPLFLKAAVAPSSIVSSSGKSSSLSLPSPRAFKTALPYAVAMAGQPLFLKAAVAPTSIVYSSVPILAQEEKPLSFEGLDVEGVVFAPTVLPPGSTKELILGGAGTRGLEINGVFIKFTSIGIYVEEEVIKHLSPKLKGKAVEELCKDELLFEELLRSPHEKLVRVVLLAPLTGVQYSEKVLERIQVQGLYRDLQEKHRQHFLEAFKAESFPPGSAVLLSFSPEGLKVAFSKDSSIPEKPVAVVEDGSFAEAVLATIIWKDGVSPAAKVSLAERLSKCF